MSNWQNRIIKTEFVNPKTIVKNPDNYREHPDLQRQMMDSILDQVGWVQTVIVNVTTGHLIDGHMRVEEAIAHGEDSIPVTFIEISEEEESRILATFDPVGSFAKESSKKFEGLISNITADNTALSDLVAKVAKRNRLEFGVDGVEREKPDKDQKREQEEEDRKKLAEKWGVKLGQTWVIPSKTVDGHNHILVCGDSSEQDVVRKLMGKQRAKLFATDPPYGIDFEQKFNPKSKDWEAVENDFRKGLQLREWFKGVLQTWMPFVAEDSAYYIWSGVFEEGFALYYALLDAGLHVQGQMVWGKNVFSLGQTDYHWQHENCWYAFKKGKNHRWYGGRDQSTLWDIKKVPNNEYIHPMQKPVDLYSIPIRNHTKAGDIVVDPFSGSGTQIVAAEQHGRLCYAVELDPIWVAASLERFTEIGLEPILQ